MRRNTEELLKELVEEASISFDRLHSEIQQAIIHAQGVNAFFLDPSAEKFTTSQEHVLPTLESFKRALCAMQKADGCIKCAGILLAGGLGNFLTAKRCAKEGSSNRPCLRLVSIKPNRQQE